MAFPPPAHNLYTTNTILIRDAAPTCCSSTSIEIEFSTSVEREREDTHQERELSVFGFISLPLAGCSNKCEDHNNTKTYQVWYFCVFFYNYTFLLSDRFWCDSYSRNRFPRSGGQNIYGVIPIYGGRKRFERRTNCPQNGHWVARLFLQQQVSRPHRSHILPLDYGTPRS